MKCLLKWFSSLSFLVEGNREDSISTTGNCPVPKHLQIQPGVALSLPEQKDLLWHFLPPPMKLFISFRIKSLSYFWISHKWKLLQELSCWPPLHLSVLTANMSYPRGFAARGDIVYLGFCAAVTEVAVSKWLCRFLGVEKNMLLKPTESFTCGEGIFLEQLCLWETESEVLQLQEGVRSILLSGELIYSC